MSAPDDLLAAAAGRALGAALAELAEEPVPFVRRLTTAAAAAQAEDARLARLIAIGDAVDRCVLLENVVLVDGYPVFLAKVLLRRLQAVGGQGA